MSMLEYLKTALAAYPAPKALEGLEQALARLSEADAARVRDAEDVHDVLAVLDPTTSMRVRRILADLRELPAGQGSEDALRAALAIADALPDCSDAFWFAAVCAEARAGDHPRPDMLEMELDQEGLHFSSPSWYFWGERSEEAMRAARAGFWATILHKAGLDDDPQLPESIAPDRTEPDGPIAPGLPEALQDLVAELEDAEGEDEEIAILREIADDEASGAFAAVDESLWVSLSDELRALAEKHGVGVGARLSALIDVALGCAQCWAQADRIREELIEALLSWECVAQ